MRFPPPSVIASWPTPNYIDPPTQKPYLIPLLSILTFAATCMVVLRLYARFFHAHIAGTDDWLVVLAIIPGIAYTICISVAVSHFGWDRHIWDIPPGPGNINQVRERAISWASQMLYQWTASLTKISLLCFYRRAFTTPRMQKVVTWFLAITITYSIACVLLLCLECHPLKFYWDEFRLPLESGYCMDEGTALMTSSILNLIIDMIILVLPIRTVLSLNILWTQKLQVLSIFAAGVLVVISSAIRIYGIWQTTEVTFDVTWHGYYAYLFTGVEIFVGIICACLPACRGLLKQWRVSSRQSDDTTDDKTGFGSTMDSTRASMPPPNGIKARTKTTVNVEYMKMEDQKDLDGGNGSESSLRNGVEGDSHFNKPNWAANGLNGNSVTAEAWAGKKKKVRRLSTKEEEGSSRNDVLEIIPEKARMVGSGRKVAFEDEESTLGSVGSDSLHA